MRLNTKISLFSVTLSVAMILVLSLVSLLSFRQFSLLSAEEHIRTAAEVVRVSLTESMVNGVIDRRASFLTRLAEVPGLQSARVVRGPLVIKQFGAGLGQEEPADEAERKVLASGKPFFVVENEATHPIFRGTIPFVATTQGTPNCLQCHMVPEGSVLGAVTLTMSIGALKRNAFIVAGVMVLAVALFTLAMMLFLRRMVSPLITTANDVKLAVEQALKGDFSAEVQQRTDDEIGQIATELNQLFNYFRTGLGTISSNVGQLLKQNPKGDNLLTATTSMVEGLIDAAHFKQAIEEDESKTEIYDRLANVVANRFGVGRFSIYEVVPNKNQMSSVMVDGELNGACRWCDPQILVRSEACRVRRTGHAIDAVDTPGLCYAFQAPEGDDQRYTHICLPIIQSGAVGSVLQLVTERAQAGQVRDCIAFLNVFLREAAPVLEAKRLMETLRESTLRDAMTSLHNRRFLEEYYETLAATVKRRQARLGILMLDLDYFKMVNDTYGHDAGDSVLKAVAKVLVSCVRASDFVIRYGGEEFLILLQDCSDNTAMLVAEKIRLAVEELKILLTGAVLQKTISIGVSEYPTDSDTFWQAVKFADVALYRAKEEGRNRVVAFRPEMWQEQGDY